MKSKNKKHTEEKPDAGQAGESPEEQETAAGPDAGDAQEAPPEEKTPEEEIAEWKDRALRSRADLENFRKRVERERLESVRYANAGLLEELLPILDNFNMGLEAARGESEDSMIFKGMEMVSKQLLDFLEGRGVKEVEAAHGKPFDPACHDAVGQEEHDEMADGHVIRVARLGYHLHDRLLRPASVIVSKASSGAAGTDGQAQPEGEEA